MIKQTFYNLPKEKREKIIDVTIKEFQKGKKQKITINNVIKEAGISRGSFYQYFDDKLDLVEVVVDDMLNKMEAYIEQQLIENNGDIFDVFINIFDIITLSNPNAKTLINVDMDENQNKQLISEYMQYRNQKYKPFLKIIDYIDTTNFKKTDDESIGCVVTLLFDLMKSCISSVNKKIHTVEEERRILINKIDIIKTGALA